MTGRQSATIVIASPPIESAEPSLVRLSESSSLFSTGSGSGSGSGSGRASMTFSGIGSAATYSE
nr:MAG TPA: GTP-binding nuclear protein [Caudoviricetes sp.]